MNKCKICGAEIPAESDLCWECLAPDPLDAEYMRYPCKRCDEKDGCNNKKCPDWVQWFEAKWREVVRGIKNDC